MNTLVERVVRVYEPLEAVGWPAGRPYKPEPIMTVARSVGDVLSEHMLFEVESIDRMYLNVWVPRLAYGGGSRGSSSAIAATVTPRRR